MAIKVKTSREFAATAGFPERWKERDLQDYIINRMKADGWDIEDEVKLNGGRADIVATRWNDKKRDLDRVVVECKKYGTRDDLYQGFGQATCYKEQLTKERGGKWEIWVMGLLPQDEQESAVNTALYLEKNGATVIFPNADSDWFPETKVADKNLVNWFGDAIQFRLNFNLQSRIARSLSGLKLSDKIKAQLSKPKVIASIGATAFGLIGIALGYGAIVGALVFCIGSYFYHRKNNNGLRFKRRTKKTWRRTGQGGGR